MVSKNFPVGIKILIPTKYWYLVGLKVRESFYTLVIIWVNTILGCIDIRTSLDMYECSCMIYRPADIENKISSNIHTLLVSKDPH